MDGVYVNGHGPFRFLLDTGANVNLIDNRFAGKIGMRASSGVEFASVTRRRRAPASAGNTVALDSAQASRQEFLSMEPEALRDAIPGVNGDVQGLIGQAFLSRFDYFLDLRRKKLKFGSQERDG